MSNRICIKKTFIIAVALTLACVFTWGNAYADCSQAEKMVLSVPEFVPDTDSTSISVSGGIPPYKWTVCGTGFGLDNDETNTGNNELNTSVIGCRYGTVTVIDSCGKRVEASPRGGNVNNWQLVTDYNGDCILQGTAEEHSQGGYFSIIEGKYKLTQQTGSYDSSYKCVEGDICAVCCDECYSIPESDTYSCFSNWEGDTCIYDIKVSDTCITKNATHHGGCGPPLGSGCGNIYLMSYCFRHQKQLFEWNCNQQQEEDCELNDNDNLGDCPR